LDSTCFTSHAVAKMLGVSTSAVLSWIDKGLIAAHRTPGGHRRVDKAALVGFLRQNAMPIPRALAGKNRVLVIGGDPDDRKTIERMLRRHAPGVVVQTANGTIDGLIGIGSLSPDAVVLDAHMPGVNAVQVCSRIGALPETEHVVVVALIRKPSQARATAFIRAGAAACLVKPPDPRRLLEALRLASARDAYL
jgi:excisionase family DNA binding protein